MKDAPFIDKTVSTAARAVLVGFGCSLAACSFSKQPASDINHSPPQIVEAFGIETDPLGGLGGPEDGPQALGLERLAYEEAISNCMRLEGFDYVPFVPAGASSLVVPEDSPDPGTRQFYGKYGFLISTSLFSQSQVGSHLVGFDEQELRSVLEDDPNQEIVENLTGVEAGAYYSTLFGDEPENFDGWTSTGGCTGQALRQTAWGVGVLVRTDFVEEIAELSNRIDSSDEMLAFQEGVSSCMALKGFGARIWTRASILASGWREDELNDILSRTVGVDPTQVDPDVVGALSAFEQEIFFQFGRLSLSFDDREMLATIQAQEVSMAVAVFDCDGLGDGYEAIHRELYLRFRDELFADNVGRLHELAEN